MTDTVVFDFVKRRVDVYTASGGVKAAPKSLELDGRASPPPRSR